MERDFFYANATQVGYSQWEITLVFQRMGAPVTASMVKPPEGKQAAEVIERMDVAMTPAHAKLFAAVALSSIMDYEKAVNPVTIPAEQKAAYDKAIAKIKAGLGA